MTALKKQGTIKKIYIYINIYKKQKQLHHEVREEENSKQ